MMKAMTRRLRTISVGLGLLGVLLAVPAAAGAAPQEPPGGGRGRGGMRAPGLAAAEVERLFDGYVAMQAPEALELAEGQHPQFLARLKTLQEVRRRHLRERRVLVGQLNRLLRAGAPAEGPLRDVLRRLRELDAGHAEEMRKAYDGIDDVLDVKQQARFRVFEESVERRKFELILRARRSAAQREGR